MKNKTLYVNLKIFKRMYFDIKTYLCISIIFQIDPLRTDTRPRAGFLSFPDGSYNIISIIHVVYHIFLLFKIPTD